MKSREIPLEASSGGEGLELVAGVVRRGGVVAYPAETMYGLGGNGLDPEVHERIGRLKGSAPGRPFLVLADRIESIHDFAEFPVAAAELARLHWPGPLTLLLPALEGCAAAREGKVAVRIPDLPAVRRWIESAGVPLISTSANRASREPARRPADLRETFGGEVDLIVAGPVFPPGGPPSTIVDASVAPPRLVRSGAVPFE